MQLFKRKDNRWDVLNQSFFKLFITFALIQLTNVGAGLIDGLMVSNFLSPTAMAASGIGRPIFSIVGLFSGLFATGMQTICSRELGKGDVSAFNRTFNGMMCFGTAVSLVLTALLMVFARPLAALLGASGNGLSLQIPASEYLRGVGVGLPALIMTGVLASAINMDSGRKRVIQASITGAILNLVFDLAAVALRMGLFGIGLATALAQYAQIVVLLLHFRQEDRMLRFAAPKIDLREIGSMLSNGTEKALRRLGNVLQPILVNKLILAYGGTIAMTVMSVHSSVGNFTQFVGVGLADTLALLAGVFYGEMNDEAILESHRNVLRYILWICGPISVLLWIFASPIARLFVPAESELLGMTAFAIRLIALQTPLNALVRSRIAYLQAVNHTRSMQLLTMLSTLVYVVLSAFVLGRLFRFYGVISCFLVSDVLVLLTCWIYRSVKTRKPIPTLEEFLALPENFHHKPGDVIYLDIHDATDATLVSEQITLFCNGHNIDPQIGNKAALCFEELALITIRQGFPFCKRNPCIDMRVMYDPQVLVVRLQDNCPPFDVCRQMAMDIDADQSAPEERLALKLLANMADDITYVHSLETNNVIMRFPLAQT